MTEAAEAPKDGNGEEKEEDDELAEYGLDKYDEEDIGKGRFYLGLVDVVSSVCTDSLLHVLV